MNIFVILSDLGEREWHADNYEHAIEQHELAFPEEEIITVEDTGIPSPYND